MAAGNVVVPAVLLLEERGYVLTIEPRDAGEHWIQATRGDVMLVAPEPIALLGLASLAEARGESWRATDEQINATLARFGAL